MKTPYHDDDGLRVKQGMFVTFSYGIPPVHVCGEVIRKNNVLTVITPNHSPASCRLSELREFVGSFYRHYLQH